MIASSVCTARAGNLPIAVSPASMIASTPSATALAASLTSARVGRGSSVIDSSTCVATMTGMPRCCAPRVMVFCARGTCSSGISSPRSPRATMTASHDSRISLRCSSASGRSSFATRGTSAPPDVCHQLARLPEVRLGLHEADRDHVDAERQPEPQIVGVLRRDRRRGQLDSRRIDPLVLADLASFNHSRLNLPAVGGVDAQLDEPIGQQQAIAGLYALSEPRERRRDTAGAAGEVAGGDRQPVAGFDGERPPPSSVPVRIFGPPRSWRIATSRCARRAAARIRSNVAPCESCVPCEKFRRKMSVPAAMSASRTSSLLLAGPTVAIILVCLKWWSLVVGR